MIKVLDMAKEAAQAARTLKRVESMAHPASELFPMLGGDEFEALKADIREHGQREPIVLVAGEIVDGRNRMRACEELGIEPLTRNLTATQAGDVFSLVMSLNFHRRHLRPHEKGAALAAYMERVGAKNGGRGRPKKSPTSSDSPPKTLTAVAEQLGIPQQTASRQLQAAADYKAATPELRAKVDAGEMTPKQAAKASAKQEKPEPREEPTDSDRLQDLCDRFFEKAMAMIDANGRLRSRLVANLSNYLKGIK